MARTTLSDDIESLKGLGHGAIGLVNTAILLALVAVIVSKGSNAPQVITQGFSLVAWLVNSALQPVTQAAPVQLTGTLQPAGSYGVGSSSGSIDSGSWDNLLPSGSGASNYPIDTSNMSTMIINPS